MGDESAQFGDADVLFVFTAFKHTDIGLACEIFPRVNRTIQLVGDHGTGDRVLSQMFGTVKKKSVVPLVFERTRQKNARGVMPDQFVAFQISHVESIPFPDAESNVKFRLNEKKPGHEARRALRYSRLFSCMIEKTTDERG